MKGSVQPLFPTECLESARSIHRVMQTAYRVEAELLGIADFAPLRRTVEEIRASANQFLARVLDDEVIAVIEVERELEPLVASLVVDPAHVRRGHATALIGAVLQLHTATAVTVRTARANEPALRLYRGLGFEPHALWETDCGILMTTLRHPNGAVELGSDRP